MVNEEKNIEFEIIKEPWNKYEVSDGSVLKTRTILLKVTRIMENEIPKFTIDVNTFDIITVESNLIGKKDNTIYSPQVIADNILNDDVRYNTLSQEFNEYILDEGSKIKIYTNVTRVSKSKLFNHKGEPIYNIAHSHQVETTIAKHYKPSKDI